MEWEFAQSTYASVLADLPAALFPYWVGSAHQAFAGIPRDASFHARSAEGLMMFFDCAAAAARTCALPSRAADPVWHAWTRLDAPGLDAFCIRHVGRAVPGVERMREGGLDRVLAVCLVQARRRLPHHPGLVARSPLDELGNPEGKADFPGSLRPEALRLAGLVSEAEYAAACGRWMNGLSEIAAVRAARDRALRLSLPPRPRLGAGCIAGAGERVSRPGDRPRRRELLADAVARVGVAVQDGPAQGRRINGRARKNQRHCFARRDVQACAAGARRAFADAAPFESASWFGDRLKCDFG